MEEYQYHNTMKDSTTRSTPHVHSMVEVTNTLVTLLRFVLDVLRDNEHLVGHTALRVMTNIITLKMIEPQLDALCISNIPTDIKGLHEFAYFSVIANSTEKTLSGKMDRVWSEILAVHPKTSEIFPATKTFGIRRDSTWITLCSKINSFPFLIYPGDIYGDAYEEVIKDTMKGKIFGQFFTPPKLIKLILSMVTIDVHDDGTHSTIFDPAMGTGGFLVAAKRHIDSIARSRDICLDPTFNGLGGREVDDETFALARANMYVREIAISNLQHGDSICIPFDEQVDMVLTNPPFGISGFRYEDINESQKLMLPVKTNTAVSLFIQRVISMLKVGGTGCIIVPDGQDMYSRSQKFVRIRKLLVHTCNLLEIVSIPSGVFSNTSVKTCVIHFVKKTDDVTSSVLHTSCVQFSQYDQRTETKTTCINVPIKQITDNLFDLTLKRYVIDASTNHALHSIYTSAPLEEIAQICKKGNINTRSIDNSGKYPFYNASATNPMGTHGSSCFDGLEYILFVKSGGNSKHPINTSYGIGKVFHVKGKTCGNSEVIQIIPDVTRVLPLYLFYFLDSKQRDIQNLARYSTNLGHIQMSIFKKFPISLPSLDEQATCIAKYESSRSVLHQRKESYLKMLAQVDMQLDCCFDDTLQEPLL